MGLRVKKIMNDNNELNYQIIDTSSKLENAVRDFEREKTVAVDLEADSMYHFKEKVCLIQIASKCGSIVIDPLHIEDLSPLKPLFLSNDIKKIFHGSDYDVRSLYRDFDIEINNLFDTEIACRFLGIRETGLEAVLNKLFNVCLNKKYQKKDWSKRPLPGEMMEYAAKDVIHLAPLGKILEEELEKKGRLLWVSEECEILSNKRPVAANGKPLYLKFKGAGRLIPRNLAVLEALLRFRMNVAKQKDKPLFKVLGNDSLMKIAMARPLTLKRLQATKALSRKQISVYGKALVSVVNKAMEMPEKDLPVYPRKKAPALSPLVPKRVKALKRWRDARAEKLEIDPALLCNKTLISTIATKNPLNAECLETIKEMKNWQKTEFGRDIIEVLKSIK